MRQSRISMLGRRSEPTGSRRWSAALTYVITATPIPAGLGAIGGGQRLADAISQNGLTVDVLVNNAGYGHAGAFNGSDAATQLGMIDLNDRALVELTHIYWPRMIANRRGGVLNVATHGKPTSGSRSPACAIAFWRRSCGSCRARRCCAACGIFNRRRKSRT